MRFSLGATVSQVAAVIGVAARGVTYVKDNLKIYFNFNSTRAKTLEFVGTGSTYFTTNDKIDFTSKDLTADFTIAFWVKTQNSSNSFYLNNSAAAGEDFINFYGGTFDVEAGNDVVSLGTGWSESHVWKHVTITRLGALWTLYVDGVSAHSVSDNTNTFTYDRMGTNGSDYGQFYTKNLGIWERALSASEVSSIMYKTYDDLKGTEKTHLYAWYALDSSTDTYNDSHGTNHATNSGSTLKDGIYADYSPKKPRGFDNAPEAQADLIGSGSVSLNGSSDYVDCGSALPDITSGAVTVVGWYKVGASGTETLFSRGVGSSGDGYSMSFDTTPRVIVFGKKASGYNTISYNATFTLNQWYHIAWVNAGTNNSSKLYVDGVLVVSKTWTVDITADTDKEFKIGSDYSGNNEFNGNIAQVGWFSGALTQEQIQSIKEKSYSELTTSEKTNLVSWWGLDVNANDEHGSNNGTLS